MIVESGADLTNSFLVRRLSRSALDRGRRVTFLTSRDEGEVREALEPASGATPRTDRKATIVQLDAIDGWGDLAPSDGLLAVDSFSFLTLDLGPQELAHLLRQLRTVCRSRRSTAVLATDRGMFDPRAEAIAIHLVDGYIQFHSREGSEGPVRFLRIPKWTDGKFFDRNIYYDFDGQRIAIDLRTRVL